MHDFFNVYCRHFSRSVRDVKLTSIYFLRKLASKMHFVSDPNLILIICFPLCSYLLYIDGVKFLMTKHDCMFLSVGYYRLLVIVHDIIWCIPSTVHCWNYVLKSWLTKKSEDCKDGHTVCSDLG